MACTSKLTADLLNDCATVPKTGLMASSKAVLINQADIDLTSSTSTGAQITDLVLNASTTGYKLEYVKQLASTNSNYAPSTDAVSGFKHNFLGRLLVATNDNAERSQELANGRYIVVVETPYGGEDKYKVYGWENGLEASEMIYNVDENSGAITFTLTTPENAVEPYLYMTFFETDDSTSKTAFDSLFASV